MGIAVDNRRRRDLEQIVGLGKAVLASGAGKQAVVPDAVEASRHVDQEAADELVGGQDHDLLLVAATAAIILVAEGDLAGVEL